MTFRRAPGSRRPGVWGRRWHVMLGLLALAAATWPAVAGAYQRPGTTELVTASSDDHGAALRLDITPDGRFVAFTSAATDLVPGATSGAFVYDRETGVTEQVSIPTDGDAYSVSISADGRDVALQFLVSAGTLFSNHCLVHDRQTETTERVDVASDGSEGNGSCGPPTISRDGRFVAFNGHATNLVPGDTNGTDDIFVHDRETGTTERVSVASDGTQGTGGSVESFASISADGRFVAFDSTFTNLVPGDTNRTNPTGFGGLGGLGGDVFVHDRETGTTERVSVASDGSQSSSSAYTFGGRYMSDDGRFVVFSHEGQGLVSTDTTEIDLFVHDRETGTTEKVSVASDGTELVGGWALFGAISPGGRFVAWRDDSDPDIPVVVRDRATGVTERADVTSDGVEANGVPAAIGSWLALSAGGRYLAFRSTASNLAPGDANTGADVFVRDRGPVTGIGGLDVRSGAEGHAVSGWATFSGATLASAPDAPTDGDDPAGAEITRASIIQRGEQQDLLVDIELASLPSTCVVAVGEGPCYGGVPGTVYRLSFTVAQTAYEIRATPADAATPAHVALYKCTPTCTETEAVTGAVGTTGPHALMSVPLDALGLEGGGDLTQLVASVTGLGSSSPADTLALPDAHVEVPRVQLGIGPPTTPDAEVPFTTDAELVDGRFSAVLDTSALFGPQRLWGRACLVETCGLATLEFAGRPVAPSNQSPPVIDGAPAVGNQLSCVPGSWSGFPAPTFTYRWLRDGAAIAGATSDSYRLVEADAANAIACRVSATNSEGSREAASAPVIVPAVPPSAGSAVVEGNAAVGAVLTCVPSGFGGAPAPTYSYQWRRDDKTITGSPVSTYTVTEGDSGHALTCVVTATNPGGSAAATSAGLSVPAPAEPAGSSPDPQAGSSPTTAPAPGPETGSLPPGTVDRPFGRAPALKIAARSTALRYVRVRGRRTLKFRLVSREPLATVTASLTRGKRTYGRGRLAKLTRSGTVTVRLTRPLRRGAYSLRLSARRADGSGGRITLRIVVR